LDVPRQQKGAMVRIGMTVVIGSAAKPGLSQRVYCGSCSHRPQGGVLVIGLMLVPAGRVPDQGGAVVAVQG
jgi:hypothetical protein